VAEPVGTSLVAVNSTKPPGPEHPVQRGKGLPGWASGLALQLAAEPELHFTPRLLASLAGTKTTGSHPGRRTSMTFPRTSGLSWPPDWHLSSSSRYERRVFISRRS
jgi:hypothetical protein